MDQPPAFDLLRTKLYRPRVTDDFITRPRLLERLERGLKRKLILVTAPAGYGKTTLIASWLQAQPLPAAWLSLDENDNDFAVFLNYFIAALRTLFANACPETTHLLLTEPRTSAAIVITKLVNEIDALAQPCVLVLDDYHVLTLEVIQDFVIQLVDRQPPNLHLVLIMRESPPLPLARWRARQDMLEIRTADLRFTHAEALQFLARMTDERAARATVEALEVSTEGWIVGLRLAALALRRQTDYAYFAAKLHQSGVTYVRDYLLDEVLQRQSLNLQDFLIRTALLDRFCAELCNALWQQPATEAFAIELIAQLDRANLFIVPLDDQGEWFRYHHLFGELLRQRAAQRLTPAVIDELHRRAGNWFAAHNLIDEAIQQFLAAHDEAAAARLVEHHFRQYLNRNYQQKLKLWLAQLPPALVDQRPMLLIAQAWVKSFEALYAQIPPLLQRAEELLDDPACDLDLAEQRALRGQLAAQRCQLLFNDGHFAEALNYAEQALTDLPVEAYYARGSAINYRCLALNLLGQREIAERFLIAELEEHYNQAQAYSTFLMLTLCSFYAEGGELDRLYEIAQRMVQFSEQPDLPVMRGWGLYFMGHAQYERNNLTPAEECFRHVIELDYLAHRHTLYLSWVELALTHQAQDRSTSVAVDLEAVSQFSPTSSADLASLRAQLEWLQGDLETALHWAANFAEEIPPYSLGWLEVPHLVQAWILISDGTPANVAHAEAILADLLKVAEAQHNLMHLIGIRATQAWCQYRQGAQAAALDQLAEVIQLARPLGLIRLFADFGSIMADMLRQLRDRGLAPQYLDRVLAACPIEPPVPAVAASAVNLTWREMEVLRLLAQHLTNQEIAARLVVTPDAVKKHLQRIYRKLGVSDRRTAISRAAELNLL